MITVTQALTIKEKVKQEMLRRNLAGTSENFGSLTSYGSANYEFQTPPASKTLVKAETGEKIVNLLYTAVEDIDQALVVQKTRITQDFDLLKDYVDLLEAETMEGNVSSCRGACSGLCLGSCIGGCNSCIGTCSGKCTGCTASCGTGCANLTRAS